MTSRLLSLVVRLSPGYRLPYTQQLSMVSLDPSILLILDSTICLCVE